MRSLPVLLSSLLLSIAACLPAIASESTGSTQPGTPGKARSGAPAQVAAVRAAEHRRAEAVGSRDITALRTLISGDYYHVESGGRARTKTEFLQLLTRDEFEFRSYEIDDMEIRMLDNGRAALVTGRFRAVLQGSNRPRELRGRYVRMWILEPEGWRNTMHQSTEIRTTTTSTPGKRLTED